MTTKLDEILKNLDASGSPDQTFMDKIAAIPEPVLEEPTIEAPVEEPVEGEKVAKEAVESAKEATEEISNRNRNFH